MDRPNYNMEEFFKRSLDKYNEEPSDQVWKNLNEKLDSKKPIFGIYKGLIIFLPFTVLLFAFAGLYIKQRSTLNEYKKQLSQVLNENEQLHSKLLVTDQPKLIDNNNQNKNSKTIVEQTKYLTQIIRDTIYLNQPMQVFEFGQNHPSFMSKKDANNFVLNKEYERKNNTASFLEQKSGEAKFTRHLSPLKNNYFTKPIVPINKRSLAFSEFNLNKISLKDRKRNGKQTSDSKVLLKNSSPWGYPEFYYRIGPSLSMFSTLKEAYFSASTLGFGFGLLQELGFTSRFAIQVGFYDAFQEYAIGNNILPLEDAKVSSFPQYENYFTQVTRIEVENKYYEIPVRLKYDFYQDNLKSFFISPGLNWSILRNQDFTYFLTENRIHNLQSNRKFGYLNAMGISLGIEKSINSFLSYQLSVDYEHAIEPFGIELQYLNKLNLKFNLLFGKK